MQFKWTWSFTEKPSFVIDHHHQQIPSNTHSIAYYSVIERAENVIELNRYDDDKAFIGWNFGGKNGKNCWKYAHLSVNITEMFNREWRVKLFVKNSNGKCDFRLHDRSNILVQQMRVQLNLHMNEICQRDVLYAHLSIAHRTFDLHLSSQSLWWIRFDLISFILLIIQRTEEKKKTRNGMKYTGLRDDWYY